MRLESTIDHYRWIGDRLRQEDLDEIYAGHPGANPSDILARSLDDPESKNYTVFHNGVPGMVGGYSSSGVIWMLCTEEFMSGAPKKLHKESIAVIRECLDIFGVAHNMIWAGNHGHIKWCKRLGFTVVDCIPEYNEHNEIFFLIHMSREDFRYV